MAKAMFNGKYRYSHIFWGSFLISLGIGILIFRYITFPVGIISFSTSLSLILLLLGISFFNIHKITKQIIIFLVGIILSFIILNAYHSISYKFDRYEYRFNSKNKSLKNANNLISFDGIQDSASINISGSCMNLELTDISTGAFKLNYVDLKSFIIKYDSLTKSYDLATGTEKLSISDIERSGTLQISDSSVWSIKSNVSASNLNWNFSNVKLSKLFLSSNTSEIFLELGDRNPVTEVLMESDMSEVNINIPYNAYCELSSNVPLSDFNIDDMNEVYSGYYTCGDSTNCSSKIKITLTGSLSDFKISRIR